VKRCITLLPSSFVNVYLGLKFHPSLDLLLRILEMVEAAVVMAAEATAVAAVSVVAAVVVLGFQNGVI
jgi:hypothetical protein